MLDGGGGGAVGTLLGSSQCFLLRTHCPDQIFQRDKSISGPNPFLGDVKVTVLPVAQCLVTQLSASPKTGTCQADSAAFSLMLPS